MFRVIKETKPTWVIGENVRNIISISEGMVLEQVYLDLESEGYEVQSFIIPASAVNAPHQRYRTWIVAHTSSIKLDVSDDATRISEKKQFRLDSDKTKNRNEVWSKTERCSKLYGTKDVSNTDSQRGCLWETDRQNAEDVGQSPRCKVTGNWDFEPNVGRVANGIPNRVDRLRGLGNAIVPQIAYQIGKAIMEAENDNR
jgi:DNA (cytosine-5)-methyltransferase 1